VAHVSYTAVWGAAGDPSWNVTEGLGVLLQDPGFTSPVDGDFSLLPDAAAVDAGDPASPCEAEPHDGQGECRIDLGHLGNRPGSRSLP